jgi:hypothetical protein
MSKAPRKSLQLAWDRVGGLSAPAKMPEWSTSTPASLCNVGTRLREVKDSTCAGCYAFERGNYRFQPVQDALMRRYEALESETWVDDMTTLILALVKLVFRWHDSGDIKNLAHLQNIVQVALNTPHIRHWLPTREYRVVSIYRQLYGEFPPNLAVRLSAHMVDAVAPSVGLPTSQVTKDINKVTCHATLPGSDHKCHDCRACWDTSPDSNVTYYKHG